MSHGLYDRCECGHVHPEHSLFGTCRACLSCEDYAVPGQDLTEGPDHALRQCGCRGFVLAVSEDGVDGDADDDGNGFGAITARAGEDVSPRDVTFGRIA